MDALDGKFYMGAALNASQIFGKDTSSLKILDQHFNSIVAENCMKSMNIHPKEGEFNFKLADAFVDYGLENNMYIVGHCLVWHSQAPRWFFVDEEGNDVSREVMIERMKNHIFTVVGRYKGKVNAWDVVNEAFEDDGSWRKTKFYEIIGEDYFKLAFQFAHEADPEAELMYNDYSMFREGRRDAVVAVVKKFQEEGVQIDGIGMQGHYGLDNLPLQEIEESIIAFASTGVKVHFTELDISVLPMPSWGVGAEVSASFEYQQKMNPYAEGLPDSVAAASREAYMSLFNLLLKHNEKIKRVTTWGVADHHSWKNNWPMRGRTDYPLLFDRSFDAKPVVADIINAAKVDS
ncbi:MAG: endo-1,4-beta-xylanase [Bacteroidales bacterium]|jgi:endo-1,4-beta-xylanase|nr:endo-1,4-beta-xylanase [Bacteroidales bacterium]